MDFFDKRGGGDLLLRWAVGWGIIWRDGEEVYKIRNKLEKNGIILNTLLFFPFWGCRDGENRVKF